MNAGYSSGWCEESFGLPLVAAEFLCRAKGDNVCRFIMAHPSKIDGFIKDYLAKDPQIAKQATKYEIPGFFKRKQEEDENRRRMKEMESLNKITMGRELKMMEREKEVNDLLEELGREPKYKAV